MIDVHAHLNFKAFANDYDEVIKQAFDSGISAIINTGTSIESSKRAVELAEKYENLYAIVGIHPHHADKMTPGWDDEIKEIAKSSKKGICSCIALILIRSCFKMSSCFFDSFILFW